QRAPFNAVRGYRNIERIQDRRNDVDAFDKPCIGLSARRIGLRRWIVEQEWDANDLVVKKLLLAQPAIAEKIAVVGREDDQRIAHPPEVLQCSEHPSDVVIDLC